MSLTTRIVITAQDNASRQFGNISQNGLRATGSLLKVNKSLMQTNNNLKDLSSNRALVGGGIFAGLTSTLASFTKSSLDVKIDFDRIRNTLLGVSGSARKAGEEMAFLSSESNRLGVELRPLGSSYARLLASTSAMGISLNDSRLIFTSFAQAISGMGASREQAIRIFSALDQMASKGTVSMEELKQQLGEALPGVLQIAAKSMGMTTEAFTKLVAQGKILSKDFLVPFAKEVNNAFGGIAVSGAKLLNAELNRLLNTMDQLKLAYIEGGKGGESLADSLALIIKKVNEVFSNKKTMEDFANVGVILGKALLGLTNIIIGLNEVIQPLLRATNAFVNIFGANVIGTIAFTVALKGLISTARIAGNILGNLQGKNSKSALGSIGGGAVTGGSSRFQELMQSQQYNNTPKRVVNSSFLNKRLMGIAPDEYSFRGGYNNDNFSMKGRGVQSTALGRGFDKLGAVYSKAGNAIKGVATSFASLINPATLAIGVIGGLAAALAHYKESKGIQKKADNQNKSYDINDRILGVFKKDFAFLSDLAGKTTNTGYLKDKGEEAKKAILERRDKDGYANLSPEAKANVDKIIATLYARIDATVGSNKILKEKEKENKDNAGIGELLGDFFSSNDNTVFSVLSGKLNVSPELLESKFGKLIEGVQGITNNIDKTADAIKDAVESEIAKMQGKNSNNARKELMQDRNSLEIKRIIPDEQIADMVDSYSRKIATMEISTEQAVFLINQEREIIELNNNFIKAKEERLALEEKLKNRPEYQDINSISSSSSAFKSFRAKSMFDRKTDSQMIDNKKKLEDMKNKDKAKTDEAILKLPSLLEGLNDAVKNLFNNTSFA